MADETKTKKAGEKTQKRPEKGSKKGKAEARAEQAPVPVSTTEAVSPRVLDKYRQQVVPALSKQFAYKNPLQVPRLAKIVINMGLGAAVANPKIVDTAVEDLKAITGQRPV